MPETDSVEKNPWESAIDQLENTARGLILFESFLRNVPELWNNPESKTVMSEVLVASSVVRRVIQAAVIRSRESDVALLLSDHGVTDPPK